MVLKMGDRSLTATLRAHGYAVGQDMIRVGHRKEDLVRLGRDVEKSVLARAPRNHLEDRVLIHGHKTVVFD